MESVALKIPTKKEHNEINNCHYVHGDRCYERFGK